MQRAILIKSCQRFRGRAEACADTWLRDLRQAGIPAYVALGHDGFGRCTDHHFKFIHTDVGDAYMDNSVKLKQAIESMLRGDIDRLFICDDDTFVHPRRWLTHHPQGDLECRVFRPRTEAEKKQNDGQPWIHGGAGWWMSRRLCELYVEECNERTSADDVLVARIAAKHGIEMVDRPDLYGADRYSGCDPPERVAADNQLISCHHVQPAEMVQLWEATRGL